MSERIGPVTVSPDRDGRVRLNMHKPLQLSHATNFDVWLSLEQATKIAAALVVAVDEAERSAQRGERGFACFPVSA